MCFRQATPLSGPSSVSRASWMTLHVSGKSSASINALAFSDASRTSFTCRNVLAKATTLDCLQASRGTLIVPSTASDCVSRNFVLNARTWAPVRETCPHNARKSPSASKKSSELSRSCATRAPSTASKWAWASSSCFVRSASSRDELDAKALEAFWSSKLASSAKKLRGTSWSALRAATARSRCVDSSSTFSSG